MNDWDVYRNQTLCQGRNIFPPLGIIKTRFWKCRRWLQKVFYTMVLLLNSVVASHLVSYIFVSSVSLKGFVKVNPQRKEWLLSPVFLPREFHWQRSPVGYSPWGRKESDRTEWLALSSYLLSFFNCFLAVFVVLLCSCFLLINLIVVWWVSLTLCLDYFLFIFLVSILGLWLLWSLYVSACILVIVFKLIVP